MDVFETIANATRPEKETRDLFDRLEPQFKDVLKSSDNPLKSEASEILISKRYFVDLTISECVTLCMVLHGKQLREISQISELFEM